MDREKEGLTDRERLQGASIIGRASSVLLNIRGS